MPLLFHTACMCITTLYVIPGRKSRALFVFFVCFRHAKSKNAKKLCSRVMVLKIMTQPHKRVIRLVLNFRSFHGPPHTSHVSQDAYSHDTFRPRRHSKLR